MVHLENNEYILGKKPLKEDKTKETNTNESKPNENKGNGSTEQETSSTLTKFFEQEKQSDNDDDTPF